MSSEVSEALLEMYFFRPLVDFFEHMHGAEAIRLFKPTPQKETWVGFDQGWTRSNLTQEELFNELDFAIRNDRTEIEEFYLGYFLQFKTVKKVQKSSSKKPNGFSIPYYRAKLSLKPNKMTGLSQHETLMRLSKLRNTLVCYACGMLFDSSEVLDGPSLEKLEFVDLKSAPTTFTNNEDHSINFQTINDLNPLWCSKPVEGLAYNIETLKEQNYHKLMRKLSSIEAKRLIEETLTLLSESQEKKDFSKINFGAKLDPVIPSSFNLIKMRKKY